jgi:hypothetical protein
MANLDRDLSTQVAKMVGESGALDPVADLVADLARANYAGHGDAAGYISVVHEVSEGGVREPVVVFDHPAARFLELGHIYVDRRTGERTNRWVPGIHGMRNAGEALRE